MDPEFKEYLDKRFKKSEITTAIITAGFTFISIGFGFLFIGYSLKAMSLTWLLTTVYGIVAIIVGLIFYLKSSEIAERILKKERLKIIGSE